MSDAIKRSDAIEHALVTRMAGIYSDALKTALRKQSTFLKKIKDIDDGKIKPPQYYIDTDQVDKWRQGFTQELIRQQRVIEGIIEEMNKAGVKAADLIRKNMAEIWRVNREEIAGMITKDAKRQGVSISFAQYDKRQLDVLMQEHESPFSKIAYRNLGQNPAIRRRLQNELAQATILGESQTKIIKRIREVTGQSYKQAKRVAQTERTRVQSQARYQAGQEAAEAGIRMANRWSCKMMKTSRDAHIDRDGKWALQDDVFHGSVMHYPGDPAGGPSEVINCHCVLIPHVLRRNEDIDENGNLVERTDDVKTTSRVATNRQEALEMITGSIGFYEAGPSLRYIDDDTLIAQVNQLNALNNKFGAIQEGHTGYFGAENSRKFIAATEGNLLYPDRINLVLSYDSYAHGIAQLEQKAEKDVLSGWSMPCDPSNYAVYAVTHEYGHILEKLIMHDRADVDEVEEKLADAGLNLAKRKSILLGEEKKHAKEIFGEILSIAKENNPAFSLRGNISDYGKTKYTEAFAEVFANSQLGMPNELGDAMNEWLRRNGYGN